MLSVVDLSVRYGNLAILDNVRFHVQENEWLMLVGPNGAGKSTVINAVSQSIAYSGKVFFRDKDVSKIKPMHLARQIGVLRQSYYLAYSFTVREIVSLGRYSHSPGMFARLNTKDSDMVQHALELTGMLPLADQSVLTLSGGELQRTFLAQIFAQQPDLLILDEPTNHLDLVYQQQVFSIIADWVKQPGRAVVSVVHDLSLARKYGNKALLMNEGTVVAHGAVRDVTNRASLESVYGMDVYAWMKEMYAQWEG